MAEMTSFLTGTFVCTMYVYLSPIVLCIVTFANCTTIIIVVYSFACSACICTCTCLLHCTPVAHAVKESDATRPNFFNPPPPPSPPSLSLVSTLQVTLNTVAVVTVAPHAAPLPAAVTEVSANTVHSLTVPPVNQRSPPTRCLVLAACRVEGVVVRGGVGLLVVWEVLGLHAQAGLIHVHVQFVTTTTCTLVIYMYIYMYIV